MVKLPCGITTISGQVSQSTNTVPGLSEASAPTKSFERVTSVVCAHAASVAIKNAEIKLLDRYRIWSSFDAREEIKGTQNFFPDKALIDSARNKETHTFIRCLSLIARPELSVKIGRKVAIDQDVQHLHVLARAVAPRVAGAALQEHEGHPLVPARLPERPFQQKCIHRGHPLAASCKESEQNTRDTLR